MINKVSALIAAVLIVGSATAASAAVVWQPAQVGGVYAADVTSYGGGYSADPHERALERLADKYQGWAEYIR
jgi:hypothetical protein